MQVIKQFETQILTWKPEKEKPQIVLLLIYFTIIGQHQLTRMHPHLVSPAPTGRRQQPPFLLSAPTDRKATTSPTEPTCLIIFYILHLLCVTGLFTSFNLLFSPLLFMIWDSDFVLYSIKKPH